MPGAVPGGTVIEPPYWLAPRAASVPVAIEGPAGAVGRNANASVAVHRPLTARTSITVPLGPDTGLIE